MIDGAAAQSFVIESQERAGIGELATVSTAVAIAAPA
jgi:hypothetical protein